MAFYIRAHFRIALIGGNLTAQSTGSLEGIGGGIPIPERDEVASSRRSQCPGELARRLSVNGGVTIQVKPLLRYLI